MNIYKYFLITFLISTHFNVLTYDSKEVMNSAKQAIMDYQKFMKDIQKFHCRESLEKEFDASKVLRFCEILGIKTIKEKRNAINELCERNNIKGFDEQKDASSKILANQVGKYNDAFWKETIP